MDEPLRDFLQHCTCQVVCGGTHGTGFFTAPGQIVTCAHVVEAADEEGVEVTVLYAGQRIPAVLRLYHAEPYPDVALLEVDLTDHPCVRLGELVSSGDRVYVFGYPEAYEGGDGASGQYEAQGWQDTAQTQPLLKFKDTKITEGYSGAALLNETTGEICGVVNRTRGDDTDAGGRAIPTSEVMRALGLRGQENPRWDEAVDQQRRERAGRGVAAAALDIVLFETASSVNRPARLFGRDALLQRVDALLSAGRRVLLYGLAGNGKTAIAKTLADQRVEAGLGPFLWLPVGHADAPAVLDALAQRFVVEDSQQEQYHRSGDEGRRAILREALKASPVRLLLMDDVWDGTALFAILAAVPPGLPILITSRVRFGLEADHGLDDAIDITELDPHDALALLVHLAGEEHCQPRLDAENLCADLGHHPYAIEIAGRQMKHYRLPAGELREEIHHTSHALTLELPPEFGAEGRESVKALLDVSYRALTNPELRRAFLALGAMPSRRTSVGLLSTYLNDSAIAVRRSLDLLDKVGLARRWGVTRCYRLHDLTYSYARSLADHPDAADDAVIQAVATYVSAHAEESDLLSQDIENIVGAAVLARTRQPGANLAIAVDLAVGGYLNNRGHALGVLGVIDDAIAAARGRPESTEALHYLLSKRGNAHVDRGEPEQALAKYHEALAFAPNAQRRAILLGVIGKVMVDVGDFDQANDRFDQAYAAAQDSGDKTAMVRVLEQQSVAAFQQKDFERARSLSVTGLSLSRDAGLHASEATFLNTLGSAEFEQGVRTSLNHHQAAHDIAARIGNNDLLALAHQALGIDYHALEDFEAARTHSSKALKLYQDLAHSASEREVETFMRKFGYLAPHDS